MTTTIRPFVETDYAAFVAVHNRVLPDNLLAESELRYSESSWDGTRFHKRRLVAVAETGQPVGFGSLRHMQEQFHPDKYALGVFVDPAARRRGHGGALYDALSDILQQRRAISVRASVRESDEASIRFAAYRGFVEVRRAWQSRLDVDRFDMARFAGALERIAGQGITITTLAAEAGINQNLWPDMYELDTICARDVPDIDPFTAMPYDDFVKTYITAPYVIPEAFFLATPGRPLGTHPGTRPGVAPHNRYVGVARLWSSEEEPDILHQDLTGVIPEYRGKGVAMALKLKTVEFARANGKQEIRTWNDTLNRPMLRINEAMGFVKQPAEIAFVKNLTTGAAAPETGRNEGAAR